MLDIFDLVGDDLNALGDRIARCTRMREAREKVAEILTEELASSGEQFESLDYASEKVVRNIASLLLGRDCLSTVCVAILADNDVDQEELDLAYTIVAPIANRFAQVFDHYGRFSDLTHDDLGTFLDAFREDDGAFGYGKNALSLKLCAMASLVEQTTEIFDSYELIQETVLVSIIGAGGVNQDEHAVLRNFRDELRSIRTLLERGLNESLSTQTAVGRPKSVTRSSGSDGSQEKSTKRRDESRPPEEV